MSLADEYRPRTWDQVAGQPKVLARVRALRRRGLGGRAYWLAGPSGTGKTTVARLIAQELAEPWAISELDAGELSLESVRRFSKQQKTRALSAERPGWAFVINEAHGLRKDVLRALLVVLEDIPPHCAWLFTTTRAGEDELMESKHDAAPLLSRCVVLEFSTYGVLDAFAERAWVIAQDAGLVESGTLEDVKRLLRKKKNNLRAVLQEIEAGALL